MGRAGKRRRAKRGGSLRRSTAIAQPRDLLDDVFESGGDLFIAVGYAPGGAPFGPRVEIVDPELVFPDELPVDVVAVVEREDEGPDVWDRRPMDKDSPF
jgi:hypothetical protein